jgi:AAA family ATP:ADP antiporter
VRPPEEAVGGRAWDDLRRLVHSRYLLVLMIVVIAGQCLAAFMYNEQAKLVEMTYTNRLERAEIFAQLDFAVSALSLILQATIVGWLTTRGSLRLSLSAVPVLLAMSFSALALVPTAAMLLITQVARRATDYGLSKPTREMLFTVLNPESKFKSKSLIDTVLQRGADSVGNGLYLLVAGLGLAGISWLCALLSVLMIFATWWLGGSFGRNERQAGRP